MSLSLLASPLDCLLGYQRRFVSDSARFKAAYWARQTGKDFTEGAEIAVDCTERQTDWMIAAPSERQSIEALDKVKQWFEALNFVIEAENIIDEGGGESTAHHKSTEVLVQNGSRVIAVPGRPDTVRGFSGNIDLTEFAFFDDPDLTWRALAPSVISPFGGRKLVRINSTPNGKAGRGRRFYETIREHLLERNEEHLATKKALWSVHKVTLRDAIADGLAVDYDEIAELLSDPDSIAQELDLEFLESSNVLLPYDLIDACESSHASEACADIWEGAAYRQLYMGIDFGRLVDPSVAVTAELIGDVLHVREVLVLDRMPTPEQEEILSHRIARCRRACLDYTGPGIGLGDYLAKRHGEYKPDDHKHEGKLEKCTFTQPFKLLLYPRLRERFEKVRIRIPRSWVLREDLHSMTQKVTGSGYTYDSPRTSLGHSDRCVAMALMNRAASFPRGEVEYRSLKGRRNRAHRMSGNPSGV